MTGVQTCALPISGLLDEVSITEVPLDGTIRLGPFELTLITLTHSIPEPNGLAIRTPLGTILHTGDWKIDPDPLLGAVTDSEAIRKLGDEGGQILQSDPSVGYRLMPPGP